MSDKKTDPPEAVTNALMYEVLKAVQADLSSVKATLADHTHHLLRIRSDLNNLRSRYA